MTAVLDTVGQLLPWAIFLGLGMTVAHETIKASRR